LVKTAQRDGTITFHAKWIMRPDLSCLAILPLPGPASRAAVVLGDGRAGNIERVASVGGEGSSAVALVHQLPND
jgi:hypothetical protein